MSACEVATSYAGELVCLSSNSDGQPTLTHGSNQFALKQHGNNSKIEQLWALKGSLETAYLIRLSDHTLTSFTAKEVRWSREEALGSITHLEFFDLPGKTVHSHNPYFERLAHHDDWSEVLTNLYLRVHAQISGLISSFSSLAEFESPQLIRDSFGFNKIIVAVSSAQKLFGISSETGLVVWYQALQAGEVISLTALHLEEAAVVIKTSEGVVVSFFNPVTGQVTRTDSLEVGTGTASIEQVVSLGNEATSALLIIDSALKLTLLPNTPASRELLSLNPRFFYRIDKANQRIDGYKVLPDLTLLQTWTLAFSPSESIEAYSASRTGHLQQPAIATGNSAMLFKNTDDNLFAVATLQTRSTFRGSETDLIVHIINGVTGHTVGKARQEFAGAPVNLLMDEYWAVATYWQYKSGRYEALSIELFENEIVDSAAKILTDYYEGNRAEQFSSYLKENPKLLSRTYALTTGVKALGSTQTMQGITKQYILMIINSGQIYAVDRNWLSPRRKTEEEPPSIFDEVILPPYQAILPLVSTNIINYDRQLEGLKSLKTTWTLLESTSILAAYGLDLFSSKVMPERTYDMLTEEFSYSAILLTIGLLVVANIVGKKYFAMKEVDKRFTE